MRTLLAMTTLAALLTAFAPAAAALTTFDIVGPHPDGNNAAATCFDAITLVSYVFIYTPLKRVT